jgi:hypothetical protein
VIRRFVNGILALIGLVVVLVVYFFVPVGRFTLHEHARRIAETPPARELGRELDRAGDSLRERATAELEARLDAALQRDAGPRE